MGKIWRHIKTGNLYEVLKVKRVKTETGWEKQPRVTYKQLEPCEQDQFIPEFDLQIEWECYLNDFLQRFEKFSQ